jgi:hypothetical protein
LKNDFVEASKKPFATVLLVAEENNDEFCLQFIRGPATKIRRQ